MGRLAMQTGRRYQIKELQEHHREMVRRSVMGQKGRRIAQDMGVSPVTVAYARNSELGLAYRKEVDEKLEAATLEAKSLIAKIAPRAVQIMEELMEDVKTPAAVKAACAKDILDRAGLTPTTKVSASIGHVLITSDEITRIKQAASRHANVIDVEAEKTGA